MQVDVLLGMQWGDEGKGKIVDVLTPKYDIIARFQGGPNAGHTLEFDGQKHVLHTIPSGIFHNGKMNLIGNGVVIDPVIFKKEIDNLAKQNVPYQKRLLISRKAHLILPTHRLLDAASELAKGKDKIGSTLKGIGPTYMDKTGRNGLRVGDIEAKDFESRYQALRDKHTQMLDRMDFDYSALAEMETEWMEAARFMQSIPFTDSEYYINEALNAGKRILAEGAQGSLLDIEFGSYPFVTSSNTTAGGTATGTGFGPLYLDYILGITKAYTTRVGSGPFPTELHCEIGQYLGEKGHEFGTTTGRSRRCGWFDAVALRQAVRINSISGICLTKLDVLDGLEEVKICVGYRNAEGDDAGIPSHADDFESIVPLYESMPGWSEVTVGAQRIEDLPQAARNYINRIEELIGAPVDVVSTGPDRVETIVLRHAFA